MAGKKLKLQLTPTSITTFLDEETIKAYEEDPDLLQRINKPLFTKSTILKLGGIYFAKTSFLEHGTEFTTLTPFRINHKSHQTRRFVFGAYDPETFEIFLLFNGLSNKSDPKGESREKAVAIYTQLKNHYENTKKQLQPFAIKL